MYPKRKIVYTYITYHKRLHPMAAQPVGRHRENAFKFIIRMRLTKNSLIASISADQSHACWLHLFSAC